jgi:hypothetical protein
MDPAERDSTQDWLLPDAALPPTIAQLEQRIDEAVAGAQASESAVASVGVLALNAVEQARRAAQQAHRSARLAERVSAVMLDAQRGPEASAEAAPVDHSMRSFSERADRVAARLRALERLPA